MAAKPPGIESLLECPICLGECDDPRILACLHTLCRKCLNQHITSSAKGNQYHCPSCRHLCDVPAGGVTAVPKNFFLNSLREILQRQKLDGVEGTLPSETQVKEVKEYECCNIKNTKVSHTRATVFCVECTKLFCSNCEELHETLFSSDHQLQPAAALEASDIQTAESRRTRKRCDQHTNMNTDMYCDTCHVPMCMKCCLLKHKLHEYREIDEVAKESRAQLSDMAEAAAKLVNTLDKHLQELDMSQRNIKTESDNACQKVYETAEEIRALVTKREQTLVKEIRDVQNAALTNTRAAYKETELNKAAVQSLHSYIRTLQTSGNVTDQAVHTPGLQEQMRQQEAAPQQSVTLTANFERETQSVAVLNAMLGTVSVDKTVATPGATADTVAGNMKVVLDSPILTLKPAIGYHVSGLAMIGDCVCVTGYQQTHLWMYNTTTKTNKQHTIAGLRAVGMTDVNNNALVITDNHKKLHFIIIDPQTMSITKHQTKDIQFEPGQVSVDSVSGKLIIGNTTDNQIVVCDNTGTIESRVTVKASVGALQCALSTDNGYIVLDYSDKGNVHWVNSQGDTTHTYGQGHGEGLSSPFHVIQDSQKRLVIADQSNHKLHLVDVNRQLSHYLLTEKEGITLPTCVCLDESTSTLFVGHWDSNNTSTVSVYRWPFTSSSPASDDTLFTHHTLRIKLGRYY